MMLDVLLWADDERLASADVFAAPIPRYRPARREKAAGRPAPWVEMSEADCDALVKATDAAWHAYELASTQGVPAKEPETVLVASNGSRWVLDATGKVVRR